MPDTSSPAIDAADLHDHAGQAATLLKALAHQGRLLILCHLVTGEKSVTELERILGQRQASVSQQLARLRTDGLVRARREGKSIYYAIADAKAQSLVTALYDLFCAETAARGPRA